MPFVFKTLLFPAIAPPVSLMPSANRATVLRQIERDDIARRLFLRCGERGRTDYITGGKDCGTLGRACDPP